ncbi:MAG: toll/interleukin-1 receptor domain-containing protein [Myxococcota bacterium]|jgi:hypothetical protein|nr:toll/interleukin-1 receptor domain-containing protein [Myxococcota bacterium]
MNNQSNTYELPKSTERLLATLSKFYALQGKRQLQEIIVNAQVRIHEGVSQDNWNGGTYGHDIYLAIPEALYLAVIQQKTELQKQFREDFNKLHSFENEFIENICLEMETEEDVDWRKNSGVLLAGRRAVSPDNIGRIWGDNGYRVFLSHKSEVKKETAVLKSELQLCGVSCFVAHQDIAPTSEWQDEIENALNSMDAFVALMTADFHDSNWTDQEVGFALGRGVPIIAVKLDRDPYGFIGKFQALSCGWDTAPLGILGLLVKQSRMIDCYIAAVGNCSRLDDGNKLAEVLPHVDQLTEGQAEQLVRVFNENSLVSRSYGFNGKKSSWYGLGLAHHLHRITGHSYQLTSMGKLQAMP